MAVKDYNTDPDLNTSISGINIAEGCPPSGINNAIRQLMADVKTEQNAKDTAISTVKSRLESSIATTNSNLATTNSNLATLDASAAHKTGDETMAGTKTFSTTLGVQNVEPKVFLQYLDVKKGEIPTVNRYANISIFENSANRYNVNVFGTVGMRARTDGSIENYLSARKSEAGSTEEAILGVRYYLDGTKVGTAPSTPANSTGTQIVTADFLAKQGGIGGLAKDMGDCDANTLLTPGFFYARSKSTNFPTVSNYYVQVFSVYKETQYIRQVCYRCGSVDSNDHNIWTRQIWKGSDSTTYGEWVQVMTSKGGTFTGVIRVPTPDANSNTNHIATTEWVRGKGVLIESWHDDNGNWYRKYSDGWIEQGGFTTSGGSSDKAISFHTPFASENANIHLEPYATDGEWWNAEIRVTNKSTASFTVRSVEAHDVDSWAFNFMWRACGY